MNLWVAICKAEDQVMLLGVFTTKRKAEKSFRVEGNGFHSCSGGTHDAVEVEVDKIRIHGWS